MLMEMDSIRIPRAAAWITVVVVTQARERMQQELDRVGAFEFMLRMLRIGSKGP
jgi:hypothetical protein